MTLESLDILLKSLGFETRIIGDSIYGVLRLEYLGLIDCYIDIYPKTRIVKIHNLDDILFYDKVENEEGIKNKLKELNII